MIGDVVGKGVAAALLMANLHGALRAFAETDDEPASVMASTNRALARDSLLSEFATIFLGYLDPESGRLVYCNGGHEPPLVVRVPEHRAPTRADVDELDVGGMVVGVDPSQRYQTGVCDLGPGDVLLAFSDGVTEAMNYDLRKFTRERVREELLAHLGEQPEASARSVCQHMLWAVRRYTGSPSSRTTSRSWQHGSRGSFCMTVSDPLSLPKGRGLGFGDVAPPHPVSP